MSCGKLVKFKIRESETPHQPAYAKVHTVIQIPLNLNKKQQECHALVEIWNTLIFQEVFNVS